MSRFGGRPALCCHGSLSTMPHSTHLFVKLTAKPMADMHMLCNTVGFLHARVWPTSDGALCGCNCKLDREIHSLAWLIWRHAGPAQRRAQHPAKLPAVACVPAASAKQHMARLVMLLRTQASHSELLASAVDVTPPLALMALTRFALLPVDTAAADQATHRRHLVAL